MIRSNLTPNCSDNSLGKNRNDKTLGGIDISLGKNDKSLCGNDQSLGANDQPQLANSSAVIQTKTKRDRYFQCCLFLGLRNEFT